MQYMQQCKKTQQNREELGPGCSQVEYTACSQRKLLNWCLRMYTELRKRYTDGCAKHFAAAKISLPLCVSLSRHLSHTRKANKPKLKGINVNFSFNFTFKQESVAFQYKYIRRNDSDLHMFLAGSRIGVIQAPEEDLARWCLLRTSWWRLRGGARWLEAAAGGPSRLRLRCTVCSANSVWISVRSRPDTHRPFSTRISSPGRRPGDTDEYVAEKRR